MKSFIINHISQYKKGSNQFVKKTRGFTFKGYKEVAIIILFLIPVIYFGNMAAGQRKSNFVSPLPVDAVDANDKIYVPVTLIPTAITPTPVMTKKDIVYSVKHGDILLRIWNNETSEGKATDPTGINVKCAKKGLSNEFGYDPQADYCFSSFQASVIKVNQWFDNCLDKNTLGECLEIYSGNSKQYINSFLNK